MFPIMLVYPDRTYSLKYFFRNTPSSSELQASDGLTNL